jgi:nitroreductase
VLSDEVWAGLLGELPPGWLIGLTSIHWRESWKYGERAYRYCQHDAGHAIAAVAFSAAALGWEVRLLLGADDDAIAMLLGVDGQEGDEAEHPDCLLFVGPPAAELDARCRDWRPPSDVITAVGQAALTGEPNVLSADHHDWNVIDRVAKSCRRSALEVADGPAYSAPPTLEDRPISARRMFRQRRSAQAMDGRTGIDAVTFGRSLARTIPVEGNVPFASLPWRPAIHLLLFVHLVEGVPPGIYVLVRDPQAEALLREALQADLDWERPRCLDHLPLFRLAGSDVRHAAQRVSCDQSIASHGAFALGMLAEFAGRLESEGDWFYRALHWEAGALGQVLYLEAEAAGISSTGIGCFFDDLMHQICGIRDERFQTIYHFTVGGSVEDRRLVTRPAYEHLK